MKPVAAVVLSLAIMGSGLVQAQPTGQGSAVPRQSTIVAQPGTWTSITDTKRSISSQAN